MNNDKNNTQYDSDILVVTTDPDAHIRYASDDFCRVSGYAREALLGKNINVLRHPDMPDGPFKQLWDTVQAGQPWMGMILNRNRWGEAMWSDTYIIPTIEQEKITEYQVIYRKPTAKSVQQAASIYELRRQGKMPKALKRKQLSLTTRLSLCMLAALTPTAGWILWQTPTVSASIALLITTLLALGGCHVLTHRFNTLVKQSRRIVSHPVKQLVYTGTTDDIGQLELVQCQLLSQLDAVLRRIQNTSDEVKQSSDNSASTMGSTYTEIQTQTAALEQVAVAMEEMTATTGEVAQNTRHTLDRVQSAQDDARIGTDVVNRAINAIKELHQAIDNIGTNLTSLEARSAKIDKVVEVIHDIAEQTNLLALNAAIEAARAGENGRGFAVVADEVRSLAQRTRLSTSEISSIIEGLQEETRNISTAMANGQTLADSTVKQIEEAGSNLLSIIQAVDAISSQTTQIASATEQQNATTLEVNEQIHTISDAATQASAKAQETLEMNKATVRLAQLQSNMVERIITGQ